MVSKIDEIILLWEFGFASLLTYGVLSGFYRMLAKELTSPDAEDPLPVLYIPMCREAILLMVALPSASYTEAPISNFEAKTWVYLIGRSIAGLLSVIAGMYAITMMALSDFMTIQSITPMLTTLIAWPLFKERPKPTDWIFLLMSVTGVIFMVQPGFLFGRSANYSPPSTLGILFSLSAVFCDIIVFTSLRGVRTVPTSSISLVHGTVAFTVVFIVNMIMVPRLPPCSYIIRTGTMEVGLFAAIRMILETLASKSLPPGFVALGPVIELAFHVIWQLAVSREEPRLFSILGAVFIIGVFVLLGIRTYVEYRLYKPSLQP